MSAQEAGERPVEAPNPPQEQPGDDDNADMKRYLEKLEARIAAIPKPTEAEKRELQADIAIARKHDTWILLSMLRIFNAITMCTFFQPDEYYQALEPGWALAFGQESGAWITWEWQHQLRSSIHPTLVAYIYILIGSLSDILFPPVLRTLWLVLFPKFAFAMQAVAIDYYTWALAERIFGAESMEGSMVLYFLISSPWQWFVSTRAFSNTLETALTATALYYWPWEWMKSNATAQSRSKDTSNLKWCILLAGLASVLRPTNVLIWGILSLFTIPHANQSEFTAFLRDASVFGSVAIGGSQLADRWYYGEWTFPAANWLYFNLNENLAVFYGKNRVDYYFTEGLVWLMMLGLPFALIGVFQALAGQVTVSPKAAKPSPAILRSLAVVAVAMPVILSLISHKEVRFIYPIFPILTILLAKPAASFFHPIPQPSSLFKRVILYSILFLHVSAGIFLGYIHNRGVKSVHGWLRSEFENQNPGMVNGDELVPLNNITLGVLMPCHSIPWRSHLVYPQIEAWALTCEPPIGLSEEAKKTYLDEADVFYQDPEAWIGANMGHGKARQFPGYLLFFGQLEKHLKQSVPRGLYAECHRSFNTFWHDDWRRKGDVIVWCKQQSDVR